MGEELIRPIARVTDPVGSHSSGNKGWSWMKIGAAIGAGLAIAACVLFPPAGLVGLVAAGLGVVSTTAGAAAIGGQLGKRQMNEDGSSCSEIKEGSKKTKVEGPFVARINDPNSHSDAKLNSGAAKVYEGGLPVSRVGEESTCGGKKVLRGAQKTIVGGGSVSGGAPSADDADDAKLDAWINGLNIVSTVTGIAALPLLGLSAFRAGASASLQAAVKVGAPKAAFQASYREAVKRAPGAMMTPATRAAARQGATQAAINSMGRQAARSAAMKGGTVAVAKTGVVVGGVMGAQQVSTPLMAQGIQSGFGVSAEEADLWAQGIWTVGPDQVSLLPKYGQWLKLMPKSGAKETWGGIRKTMRTARANGDHNLALFGEHIFTPPKAGGGGGGGCATCSKAAGEAAPAAAAAHGGGDAPRPTNEGPARAEKPPEPAPAPVAAPAPAAPARSQELANKPPAAAKPACTTCEGAGPSPAALPSNPAAAVHAQPNAGADSAWGPVTPLRPTGAQDAKPNVAVSAQQPKGDAGDYSATRTWTDQAPAGLGKNTPPGEQPETWHDHFDGHPDERGKPTPERAAMHEREFIEPALAGKKTAAELGETPTAILTMGGPASGKGTILKKLGEFGLDPSQFVHVDPDEVKGALPEYRAGVPPQGSELPTYRNAAAAVHEESSYVAKQIRDRAIEGGHHIIIDGTGGNATKFIDTIKDLEAKGYEVHVHYAQLDAEEGVRRALARAEETGRMVPEKVIRGTYAKIESAQAEIMAAAPNLTVYDAAKGHTVKVSRRGKAANDVGPTPTEHAFGHPADSPSGPACATCSGVADAPAAPFERLGAGQQAWARAYPAAGGDVVVKRLRRNQLSGQAQDEIEVREFGKHLSPEEKQGIHERYTLTREERGALGAKMVEQINRVAEVFPAEVPRAALAMDGDRVRSGVVLQSKVEGGLEYEQLGPIERADADAAIGQMARRAREALGTVWGPKLEDGMLVSVDDVPSNFRFNPDGSVKHWFDPVIVVPEKIALPAAGAQPSLELTPSKLDLSQPLEFNPKPDLSQPLEFEFTPAKPDLSQPLEFTPSKPVPPPPVRELSLEPPLELSLEPLPPERS